jgi:hypothetical protein
MYFANSGLQILGPEMRKMCSEEQDLALTAARRLRNFTVNFFQGYFLSRSNLRISKQQRIRCDRSNKLALEAFQMAFPERYRQWTARQTSETAKELLDKLGQGEGTAG